MDQYLLSLILAGSMVGTLYGLVGVTLTLMLRSDGVLSFAHAGFALLAAYTYAGLECPASSAQQCGDPVMPPFAAAIVAVAVAVVVALVVERLVIRPMRGARLTTRLIATGAVLGLISGVLLQIYGSTPRFVPDEQQILPHSNFSIADVVISWQRLTIFFVAVAIVIALGVGLRIGWFGLGVRAAAQRSDIAELMGVNPIAVSRFNWALGGLLSGVAGVLIGPVTLVNVGTFSFLLVKAVGAVLLGGLVSLPLTFAGGVAIGVIEVLGPHFAKTPGAGDVAIAILVVAGLLVRGQSLADVAGEAGGDQAGQAGRTEIRVATFVHSIGSVLHRVPRPVWALVGLGTLAFPFTGAYYASVANNALYYGLLSLSVVVLSGTTGQLTFMQAGFAAVGAFGLATASHHDLPMLAGIAVTVAACAATGVVCGLVSLRFRGLQFAIVSLALGAVLSNFLVLREGFRNNVVNTEIFGWDLLDSRVVFATFLILAAGSWLVVWNLRRSVWGVSLTGMQRIQSKIAHFGIDPFRAEVALLAVSAAIAGLAGCLLALTVINFDTSLFVPVLSVSIVLFSVVGGLRHIWGPVVAALLFGPGQELIAKLVSTESANAFPEIASASLALLILIKLPNGLVSTFAWARGVATAVSVEPPKRVFRGRALPLPDFELTDGNGRLSASRSPRRLQPQASPRRLAQPPTSPRLRPQQIGTSVPGRTGG